MDEWQPGVIAPVRADHVWDEKSKLLWQQHVGKRVRIREISGCFCGLCDSSLVDIHIEDAIRMGWTPDGNRTTHLCKTVVLTD
jgi:hypothetical protein